MSSETIGHRSIWQRLLGRVRRLLTGRAQAADKRSAGEIFTDVYHRGLWGARSGHAFFSGFGSHKESIVDPYVTAVRRFLQQFEPPLNAVDLGCGDFNVGSKLRSACGSYIACDVVPALVEHNRLAFADRDVDFRVLDMTTGALPPADVVFLRQVLQHLDNRQIEMVVRQLPQYRYVVVTEHLPAVEGFPANRDKPAGAAIRLEQKPASGVVLTEAPFNFAPVRADVICEVRDFGGVIRTVVYHPA